MKAFQNINGAVAYSAREYDIAPETVITAGQVVKLVDGLVVAAVAVETSDILGVAAEYHAGKEDALNPRSDGKKILVYDAPGLVFICQAPIVEATGGDATSLVTAVAGTADAYVGGYIKLIEKAEGSTNSDPVGKIDRVTAYADGTFTKANGGTPAVGDKYAIFPPVGFVGGNLDASGERIILTASTADFALKVVGRDEGSNSIMLQATKHIFK